MTVKVRFAPSPTGYMHVGNARTALVTWLFARKNQGIFLLRIDDTDAERSKPEYEQAIEDGLNWMGLDWDEKARQKNRDERYQEAIQKLKDDGRLYPCYETAEELALKRKTQLSRGKPPVYDRGALSLNDEQIKAYEDQGRKAHWRFKMLHDPIEWNDMVRGNVQFQGSDISDPVLIREDGSPLYHICSVIDDVDYKITHVVRGEDHVSNTAAHIQMFEALGAKPPEFAHMTLLADMDGGKLSKRLGGKSLKELREEEGLEPMALISLLAKLGSSDPIDALTDIQPAIDQFDFSKFSRNTPKFDSDELIRLNAKILQQTSYADIKDRLEELGLGDIDESFWNAVHNNLNLLIDLKEWWTVANGPVSPIIEDADYIREAAALLPAAPWDENTWSSWTTQIKEKTGRKGKELFLPLRQAITGMDHGPEMPVLLPLIGSEKVKDRLAA